MLSAQYLVGLVDGEGSFCVFVRAPEKKTWNTRVECHFYIKMREDELPLLQMVQKSFKCGRISFQKEYRKNQRHNYRYQVSNLKELEKIIIPFFKTYSLRSRARKHDFQFFCRIVKMLRHQAHYTDKGLKKIIRLKTAMHI